MHFNRSYHNGPMVTVWLLATDDEVAEMERLRLLDHPVYPARRTQYPFTLRSMLDWQGVTLVIADGDTQESVAHTVQGACRYAADEVAIDRLRRRFLRAKA